MKKSYIVLSLLILVAIFWAVSAYYSPGAQQIAMAKEAVAEQMKDPDSVKFKDVRLSFSELCVCGKVNGKNGFGAYIGFTDFFVCKEDSKVVFVSDPELQPAYNIICMERLG